MSLPLAVALALTPSALSSQTHDAAPHNLLVIVLDDVGVDMIGAYEAFERAQGRAPGTPAHTPAIDQLLAAQGVTFAAAWASPKCSPTRAQLLTGLHPMRSGIGSIVRTNPFSGARNPGLNHDARVLPQQLQAAPTPYASAAVGKWHLGDLDQVTLDPGHALGAPHGSWFQHYAGSRFNLEPAAGPAGANLYFAWRKTYASAIGYPTPCGAAGAPCEAPMLTPPMNNYATVDTTEDALSVMAALPEPWLVFVAYNSIHAPLHVPPAGLPSAPCLPAAPLGVACEVDSGSSDPALARCMMSALDQQIGRLACAADPATTTVVLIGDNGSPQTAVLPPFNPLHAKGTLYEGGVRVPLIIRSPLVPPARRGAVEQRLVSSVDVHATALDVAGVAPLAASEGRSLAGYLSSASSPTVRFFGYTEAFYPNFKALPGGGAPPNYVCNFQNQALRDVRFKLIRRTTRDHLNPSTIRVTEELFDLTEGGPPDTSATPPFATPDWFEEFDLLAGTAPLQGAARDAYVRLSGVLDSRYPSLVR